MTDRIQVDVDFPEVTEVEDGEEVQYPAFKDAVYLTFQEYSSKTAEELDALRLERYEGWKQHLRDVRNAPVVEVPAEAETQATLTDMRDQAQALLDSINAQLATLPAEPAQDA